VSVRLSIVVPTYRRRELLGRCLAALAGQDLDADRYEIVVADDAASEDTRTQVVGLAARVPVRYVAVRGIHGPAAARNAGWTAAVGDVIAFTDDDTIPDAGWAAAGLGAFERNPELAAVTGRTEVPLPPAPTDYQRNESGLATAEFITANCFVRRTVLESLGGFDERFTAAWREDSDLHFALLERGWPILKVPTAAVMHPIRPAQWGICLRMQRKSRFEALLFKKHPELYRSKVGRFAPPNYYALVSMIALGTGLAIAGYALAAAICLVAWAALTLRLALRRLRGNSLAPNHVAEMLFTSALLPPLSLFWRVEGALCFRVFLC